MLVVYASRDEVLVTTDADESAMLEDYFEAGARDIIDYDRVELPTVREDEPEVAVITTHLRVD